MSRCTVILGSCWGDEGKGKLVDFLSKKADVVCRFNGGNNAGHTVECNNIKYSFHMLPCGIINENCISIIGNGCVINLTDLFEEIYANEAKNLKDWKNRLFISDRAHLIFDFHKKVDELIEAKKGTQSIGTTHKGIGPAYSAKAYRFRALYDEYKHLYSLPDLNIDAELAKYKMLREDIKPCVKDVILYLNNVLLTEKKNVIIEGANGSMLDIDFGSYPYVTSSNTTIGAVCTGLGIQPRRIGEIIGVVKSFMTRVGFGPLPTEQKNEFGDRLQAFGKEFGVTTGRKRRCGWLDLVVVKYTTMINGYTALALTKLDILDHFEKIKIATGYVYKGEKLNSFPAVLAVLEKVEVEYEIFDGWNISTSNCKNWDSLPKNAQKYIKFIEDFLKVPIRYIGVGPERDSMIEIK